MKKYIGKCHCGKIEFEVEMDISSPLICNCSHCEVKGLILSFTEKKNFKLIKGEESISEYLFNKKVIHHKFCNTCGVEPFAFGKGHTGVETVAINLRTIKDIDINSLTPRLFDGKNI